MMTDSYINQLRDDVREHGEVHAIVEEHGAEIELRRGQTTFDLDNNVVTVDGRDTTHVFHVERFVRYYRPYGVFHE